MKIPHLHLHHQLKQTLAPVYLVTGDEQLTVEETCQHIITHAKAQGYEHIRLSEDLPETRTTLAHEKHMPSLFSSHKIIDLRLNSLKLSAELKALLLENCQAIDPTFLLLIRMPKIPKKTYQERWLAACEQAGIIISADPPSAAQFRIWLKTRIESFGLTCETQGIDLILTYFEGSVLGAHQAIEKLSLTYGAAAISLEQIKHTLSPSPRYHVFEFADSALAFAPKKCLEILDILQKEGTEPALLLWALSQDLRKIALLQSTPRQQFYAFCQTHKIWGTRQKLFQKACVFLTQQQIENLIKYAQKIDNLIKTGASTRAWDALYRFSLAYAHPTTQDLLLCMPP